MSCPVGVCAIQGDFDKHLAVLQRVGAPALEVRTPDDLAKVDRLIIPGGESSTVGLLMERHGLGNAIKKRASEGMPIWGTCMGMIMMARQVEGRCQYTLGLMDIIVRRNAFGAQVHSFEDAVEMKGLDEPVLGVFIRAPIVVSHASTVEVMGCYQDKIVAVRQGLMLGTSFHPELTEDGRLHQWFAALPA
jgi:pyridoxal 5'-phosphate synthase pdxT subunit